MAGARKTKKRAANADVNSPAVRLRKRSRVKVVPCKPVQSSSGCAVAVSASSSHQHGTQDSCSQCSPCQWSLLPDEALLRIFEHLWEFGRQEQKEKQPTRCKTPARNTRSRKKKESVELCDNTAAVHVHVAAAVCRAWRKMASELLLSDTACSRSRAMLLYTAQAEDTRGTLMTSAAVVLEPSKSQEDGYEACSMPRQALQELSTRHGAVSHAAAAQHVSSAVDGSVQPLATQDTSVGASAPSMANESSRALPRHSARLSDSAAAVVVETTAQHGETVSAAAVAAASHGGDDDHHCDTAASPHHHRINVPPHCPSDDGEAAAAVTAAAATDASGGVEADDSTGGSAIQWLRARVGDVVGAVVGRSVGVLTRSQANQPAPSSARGSRR